MTEPSDDSRRSRPAIDVVVPFAGTADALAELVVRLTSIRLRANDSVTVVDNRAAGGPPVASRPPVTIVRASERHTSYYARNRGVREGTAPWIVFVDADTEPEPDLLDRYFDRKPGERCAVLAGGILAKGPPPGGRQPMAAHWAFATQHMRQSDSLDRGHWGYAQTANVAVRRAALGSVGGFREDIRGAGDADLCFRLKRAGWTIESRTRARVVHRGRATARALIRQLTRHASGGAWLNREHPGSAPRTGLARLAGGTVRDLVLLVVGIVSLDRDRVRLRLMTQLARWTWQVGRLFSNRA